MAVATKPQPGGGFIVVNFTMKRNDILDQLTNVLKVTQAAQVQEANKKRQPHNFQPGDCIMLNTRNLPLGYAKVAGIALKGGEDVNGVDTDGQGAPLSKTLRQKYMGPFTLGNQHGEIAFELHDILHHLWVHKTCIISLFQQYEIVDTRPQVPPPTDWVAKSGVSEYEIKQMADWKLSTDDGKVFLLVQ
jgi:hypothetical protein